MSSPSIEAVNLSKRYGTFLALSNLSLKIEGSKCVGFLGPNGAGKTTTLKIFTDMIRASEGKALINGIDGAFQQEEGFELSRVVDREP
jgi:ABC-2 type transport system ATP-binding protein